MFYWSPSLKRGTLYIFRPNSNQGIQHITVKGLAADAKYTVRSDAHKKLRRSFTVSA